MATIASGGGSVNNKIQATAVTVAVRASPTFHVRRPRLGHACSVAVGGRYGPWVAFGRQAVQCKLRSPVAPVRIDRTGCHGGEGGGGMRGRGRGGDSQTGWSLAGGGGGVLPTVWSARQPPPHRIAQGTRATTGAVATGGPRLLRRRGRSPRRGGRGSCRGGNVGGQRRRATGVCAREARRRPATASKSPSCEVCRRWRRLPRCVQDPRLINLPTAPSQPALLRSPPLPPRQLLLSRHSPLRLLGPISASSAAGPSPSPRERRGASRCRTRTP